MTNDFQTHIDQITKKPKIKCLDISNRDLSGDANLSEFTALTSLNSYNNKFESLDWLSALPNKDKLKKLVYIHQDEIVKVFDDKKKKRCLN